MQVRQDRSPKGQYRKNQKAKLWGIELNIYQKWEPASTLQQCVWLIDPRRRNKSAKEKKGKAGFPFVF